MCWEVEGDARQSDPCHTNCVLGTGTGSLNISINQALPSCQAVNFWQHSPRSLNGKGWFLTSTSHFCWGHVSCMKFPSHLDSFLPSQQHHLPSLFRPSNWLCGHHRMTELLGLEGTSEDLVWPRSALGVSKELVSREGSGKKKIFLKYLVTVQVYNSQGHFNSE